MTTQSLYLPPQFACTDVARAQALLRDHPLAQLVSVKEDGEPFISPLPLETAETEPWKILGHLANANPQVALMKAQGRALITVMGPQAYMSPSVYPDTQRVPTWNYVTLHAHVDVRAIDPAHEKDTLLKTLIHTHEPVYAEQWRSLSDKYTAAMLNAITGFEFTVTAWTLKVKVNQHRPEAREALRLQCSAGGDLAKGLLKWMGE